MWGLVFPLLTKADGTKYGKTAEGAVWLDPKRTSPYRFYQFFVNADDADAGTLLRTLTFLEREEIENLERGLKADPGARAAQKALARELTRLVHGDDALTAAVKASEILFGGSLEGVSEEVFGDVVGEVPTKEFEKARLASPGVALPELLVHAGLCSSKGQARKDIEGGGIYVNNERRRGRPPHQRERPVARQVSAAAKGQAHLRGPDRALSAAKDSEPAAGRGG